MKLNDTKYGIRISTCADSILAAVETQVDVLAPIGPMAQAAKKLLINECSEDVFEELEYQFNKIEQFIAKWRPSPTRMPGVFYVQPNWASSIDEEAQAARKLTAELSRDFASGNLAQKKAATIPVSNSTVAKGEAFIAMAIDPSVPDLDDVLDCIKAACKDCEIHATRVDEVESNDRITDRIVESIRSVEFVIVDLTLARPNVFFEAGFAHGLGKTPIYIAKAGTKPEFDIKDYPIIFFRNMRDLRSGLVKRLQALSAQHEQEIVQSS